MSGSETYSCGQIVVELPSRGELAGYHSHSLSTGSKYLLGRVHSDPIESLEERVSFNYNIISSLLPAQMTSRNVPGAFNSEPVGSTRDTRMDGKEPSEAEPELALG